MHVITFIRACSTYTFETFVRKQYSYTSAVRTYTSGDADRHSFVRTHARTHHKCGDADRDVVTMRRGAQDETPSTHSLISNHRHILSSRHTRSRTSNYVDLVPRRLQHVCIKHSSAGIW
jgi:hypothetical protein